MRTSDMLIEPTLDRLNELGLSGMAQAFAEQLGVPDMQSISFEDRLALLLERETSERETRRLRRLLQIAKLRLDASLEDIDFRSPRGLDKSVILRVAGLRLDRTAPGRSHHRSHRYGQDLPRVCPRPSSLPTRPVRPIF